MTNYVLVGLLVGIPYAFLLTKACSWAYFETKLAYNAKLVQRLTQETH